MDTTYNIRRVSAVSKEIHVSDKDVSGVEIKTDPVPLNGERNELVNNKIINNEKTNNLFSRSPAFNTCSVCQSSALFDFCGKCLPVNDNVHISNVHKSKKSTKSKTHRLLDHTYGELPLGRSNWKAMSTEIINLKLKQKRDNGDLREYDAYYVCEGRIVTLEESIRLRKDRRLVQVRLRLRGGMRQGNNNNRQLGNDLRRALNDHNNNRIDQNNPVEPIRGVNWTTSHYFTSKALYPSDPFWKLNSDATHFSDALEFLRLDLSNNFNGFSIYPNKDHFPRHNRQRENLLVTGIPQDQTVVLPFLIPFNKKYNYACKIAEGQIFIHFKTHLDWYVYKVPNNLTFRFHYNQNPNSAFALYANEGQPLIIPPLPMTNISFNPQQPKEVPTEAVEMCCKTVKLGAVSKWNNSTYMVSFSNSYERSALSKIFPLDMLTMTHLILYCQKINNMNLISLIEHDKYTTLDATAKLTSLLNENRKESLITKILKGLASVLVPSSLQSAATETLNKLNDKIPTTEELFQKFRELRNRLGDWIASKLAFLPPMKMFSWQSDIVAALWEEAVKIIPGGGILLAISEIFVRWNSTTILQKFFIGLFHSSIDVLNLIFPGPLLWRLASFPFRVAGHLIWNYVIGKLSHTKLVQIVTANKRFTEDKIDFNYCRKDYVTDSISPINIDETIPNKTYVIDRKLEPFSYSDTDNLFDTVIPKNVKEQLEPYTVFNSGTKSPATWHAALLHINSFSFPARTDSNLIHALSKRNYQPYPNHVDSQYLLKAAFVAQELCKPITLNLVPITTEDWINLPNHTGVKKIAYTSAYDKLRHTNEVEYGFHIELKRDELLKSRSARTICVYDNTYVVSVAPKIYSITKALATAWNGYNTYRIAFNNNHLDIVPFYASGVSLRVMSDFFTRALSHVDNGVVCLFIAVCGDDTTVICGKSVFNCDFSRYDSTQQPCLRNLLNKSIFSIIDSGDLVNMMKKSNKKEPYITMENGDRIKLPVPQGLPTGCPETSLNNTFLTMTVLISSFLNAPDIGNFSVGMQAFGLIPKAKITKSSEPFEFLKKLFYLENENVVGVPLLSSFAKFGKSDSDYVPYFPIYSESQYALNFIASQCSSNGFYKNIGLWEELGEHFRVRATAIIPIKDDREYVLYIDEDSVPVSSETLMKIYHMYYELDASDIRDHFDFILKIPNELYPVAYSSSVVDKALSKDYDHNPIALWSKLSLDYDSE